MSAMDQQASTVHDPAGQMSLVDHLGEMRYRLIRILLALIVSFFITYPFAKLLFRFVAEPWLTIPDATKLIFTGPAEVFMAYIEISIVAAILIASPYCFVQVWRFIEPALSSKEKHFFLPFVLSLTFFFLGGVAFAYYLVLPVAFQFFANFAPEFVTAGLKVSEFVHFTFRMLLAFGIIFLAPLFMVCLVHLRLIRAKQVARQWRGVVIGICIVSALLTPADALTMVMMALPLLIIFGLSLLIAFVVERKSA